MFTKVKRKKQVIIPATVLFRPHICEHTFFDVPRAATSNQVAEMLHGFTDECAAAVWERDGIS